MMDRPRMDRPSKEAAVDFELDRSICQCGNLVERAYRSGRKWKRRCWSCRKKATQERRQGGKERLCAAEHGSAERYFAGCRCELCRVEEAYRETEAAGRSVRGVGR